MIMKIICLYDKKLGIFTAPSTEKDLENADIIEGYRRMCANPQMPSQYFDYDVYLMGKFDDKTGEFITGKPEFLVSLGDYRHLKEEVKEDGKDS